MKLRKNSYGRVLRGGSYIDEVSTKVLRVAFSLGNTPVNRSWDFGFRFVVRGAVK